MGHIVPDSVEQYLSSLNHLTDPLLQEMARNGAEQQLPLIDAEVGSLLGTAIGYSGIWMAGALPPDGMLLTMEKDPERARVARDNFARAGLADRVSVIVGDAQRMLAKVSGPFDLMFQDGDKQLYGPLLDGLVGSAAAGRFADYRQRVMGRARGSGILRAGRQFRRHARDC